VTVAELTDVVAKVGNDACEVITYVLKRPAPRVRRRRRGR